MLEVARRTQSIELDLFATLARTHFEFAFPQQVGVKSRFVGFAANELQDAGPGRKRNALLALPFERNKKLGAARSGYGIDQNKIEATDDDVKARASMLAAAYEQPEEVVEDLVKTQRNNLASRVLEEKALEFLFSKAKTTEETLTFEQLSGMGRE